MKPAEEVARGYVQSHGIIDSRGCFVANPDAMLDDIGSLIRQARREGAEEMRERAALLCEPRAKRVSTNANPHTDHYKAARAAHHAAKARGKQLAEAIRALALDPDRRAR